MAHAAPTALVASIMFPTGTVRTFRPNQTNPYGVPWTNASRWEPSFSEAADEWSVDPALLVAMAIVESDANQHRSHQLTGTRDEVIAVHDHFGGGPSVGIMRIKPFFHQATLPDADVYTPHGNIRLGARLMRDFIAETGSWQNAIRLKYHPGTSPDGTTPRDYFDAINSLMAELNVRGSCFPDPPPFFDGSEKMVNDVIFRPDRRTVTARIDGLNCRRFANLQACLTREPLALGESIDVLYWLHGESFQGESRWWVAADGSRLWTGGTDVLPDEFAPEQLGGRHLFAAMRAAGMRITQKPFNPFSHSRCDCYDFGIPVGTPIPALAGGRVIFSRRVDVDNIDDEDDVYRPNKITVRTQQLGDHVYAHLSQRHVNEGDIVSAGTILGLSGDENGPHLHLQLDRGVSQLGLTLTQILEREGFNLRAFPGF